MSPQRKPGTDAEEQAEVEIPASPKPSDAESLEMVLERRTKDLLSFAHSPKSLTDAIKVANDTLKILHEIRGADGNEGWGTGLPKNGTVRQHG